ncbi:Putative white-brown complex homolog protein 30 [Seminavis robusta]|uniref:White-brown complex homolog protein 30 n=1 Tax=Seminavis robusta TaxID=568900 RepID=A0A9N8EP25_9STRA|nr:Putative white-brown complex homolog protein 30 [Seminavis robusta]|eukprot:Sro1316_g262150.1 Putative white-brown complex homolog protein 30 (1399) ;mRNA; f:18122-23990
MKILQKTQPLWLLLVISAYFPDAAYGQYEALASLIGSTQEEILELGGLPDKDCFFTFNATADNCNALIEANADSEEEEGCDCRIFCQGKTVACYDFGATPDLFSCPSVYGVVAGCQENQTFSEPLLSTDNSTDEPCPEGYMCTRGRQKKCDDIRQIPLQLGLGDVHAGMWCPGRGDRRDNGYQICEAGHYCPNSTTMIRCPAGYFCPHKTAYPDIECPHCGEAAATLGRKPYGYIVGGVVAGLILLLVIYEMFRRYNTGLWDHLLELQARNFDKVKATVQAKSRQEKLKKLEPKLRVIEKRLQQDSGSYRADPTQSIRAVSVDNKSGRIKFNARKLFDMMDVSGDGELTYEELEHALNLNQVQMREFIRRMNQEARKPPETETISREIFIKHFLSVLEQTSHFEPTATEATELFDEILLAKGTLDVEGIAHEDLFDSPISSFLDDAKINQIIKRFRELQEKQMGSRMSLGEGDSDLMPDESFKSDVPRDSDVSNPSVSRRRRSTVSKQVRRASIGGGRRSSFSGDNAINAINRFKFRRPSILTFMQKHDVITREEFIAWYPALLTEVTRDVQRRDSSVVSRSELGVDITFQNLSLTVTVKGNEVKIVDNVTGRLKAASMTALMGGSGAGKTSLLNALCGRAFYGEVTGTVRINGHETTIEEHASAVGFVPQDDIVYAELTVRENFIFSGRFQLPKDTSTKDIEDLADATMANLGLSRVMHSIVGDVTRRGVSGGEKKRVNIGLELMARPKIVFLDEPTSGLDANSALLVMESLKTLTQIYGTTICSVIHQPRKFIYELFDSLILLGVGGKMVFHGPTEDAEPYFRKLHYDLPPGESIADWLIDISSGRLGPSMQLKEKAKKEERDSRRYRPSTDAIIEEESEADSTTFNASEVDVDDFDSNGEFLLPEEGPSSSATNPVPFEFKQSGLSMDSTAFSTYSTMPAQEGSQALILSMRSALDMDKSRTLNKTEDIFEDPAAQAKARREVLYSKWRSHFSQLDDDERDTYEPPEPYELPEKTDKAPFMIQVGYQLRRLLIVAGRNWLTKTIDTFIIVGAAVLVSLMDGVEQPTMWVGMSNLKYDFTAEPTSVEEVVSEFPKFFQYAIWANLNNLHAYGTKLGVLIAVLVALTATKTITSKRKEFFREAASGYSTNAYFIAVNVIATLEHSIQIAIAALCSIWLRNSLSHWYSWMVAFLLCGWISVSWAFLFPLIVPPDNVVLVTGFYMVLFGLLFSGALAPVLYSTIYADTFMSIFSGLLSPTRYFIEALSVSESRVLPVQSGFTEFGINVGGGMFEAMSFKITGLGLNDFYNVTQRSTDGWYWGALPAFLVGLLIRWASLGFIHVSDRAKQAKKPMLHTVAKKGALAWIALFLYSAILIGLLFATVWTILREKSAYPDQEF